MLTITRKDLLLTINDNVIPAMGSSDVPVKFVNDEETYQGFMIEPRIGYYVNGCPKSTVCEYDISINTFKIPAEAFKQRGVLVIAIALIDNEDSNHIEVTKELDLEVTPAPNGTVVLPATETWQTAVDNLVEQLYNQDYKPLYDQALSDINEAVQTANTASSNATTALNTANETNELINQKTENGDFIPNIQIGTVENGETASATITGEKDNPRLNLVLPKGEQGPQGEKGDKGDIGQQGPQGPQGEGVLATHIVTELPETGESSAIYFLSKNNNYTAYMYVDGNWIPFGNQNSNQRPKQLLINNEFRINQRGQSEYNFDKTGKYGIDGWQHRQASYTNAIIVKPLAYGGCNVKLNTSAGAGLKQYLNEEDFIIRHNYTTAIYIDGIIYTGTSELYNNSGVIIENDIFKLDFYYDTTRRKVVYFIWFKNGNSEYTIEYCDLFEGTTVHEHVMDDKYTTLLKCQRRYINSNYFAINNQLVKNLREYDYHYWSISYLPVAMDSVPTITLNNDYIISHAYDSTTYYPDELSDVVNICDKNAVLLGFFNHNFVEGEEYRLYNVFVEISCEPH